MPTEATQPAADHSRRNNIGSLRLIGALMVLVGHSFILASADGSTGDALSRAIGDVAPFRMGLPGIGVAMFFAISGYLVAQSYQRRGGSLAYVEARLLRIYPALWIAIGITVLMGAIVSVFSPEDFLSSKRTLVYAVGGASLLDLQFTLPGVFGSNPRAASVNGSLWTLPVELKMYLFVAAVGVVGLLGRRLLFNLAAAAILAVAGLWPEALPLMGNPDHQSIALFFLVGTALYVNRGAVPLRGVAVGGLALLAAALSWTAAYPVLFAVAFSYAVLWLGFASRPRLPDLAARGDLSYGTYLYAFPVSQLWVLALGPGSPWLVAGLTAAVVLPMAFASWRLVEEPALRLKGRLVPPKLTNRSVIVRPSE
ncbi:MAG: acyltransferase family protein [Solirubrobacterales bacterium]